ncbi:hypothetical protein LEMLEM_LOCUS8087, partial [Lemmus lemmus]
MNEAWLPSSQGCHPTRKRLALVLGHCKLRLCTQVTVLKRVLGHNRNPTAQSTGIFLLFLLFQKASPS